MARRGLIAVSLVANVILAAGVFHLAKVRFSKPPEKISVVEKIISGSAPHIVPPERVETSPPQTNASPFAGFHWRQIESDDYPNYIANLRKVRCPEKTIHNIIIPDIEELYDKRAREEVPAFPTNFWIAGRARAAFNRERERQFRALNDEQTALVKQLLGIDWIKLENERGFWREWLSVGLPYLLTPTLSMEKTREFFDVMQKFTLLEERISSEAEGILLPEDEAKLKQLQAQMRIEGASIIPPAEYEEFNLRMGAVQGHGLFEDLKDSGLLLTPDEFRRIIQIRTAGRDMLELFADHGHQDFHPTPQQQKEMDQAIKSLLGDARYEMFWEATDNDFQGARRFADSQKLPKQVAHLLCDIQKAAEERADELRNDTNLSRVERRRQLQEVRATTEIALEQAVGAAAVEQYRKADGNRWLNSISKKPK